MNITKIIPVRIGSEYIARIRTFPSAYLSITSRGDVVEVNFEMAKLFATIQEITDIGFAYTMNINYFEFIKQKNEVINKS